MEQHFQTILPPQCGIFQDSVSLQNLITLDSKVIPLAKKIRKYFMSVSLSWKEEKRQLNICLSLCFQLASLQPSRTETNNREH